MLPCASMEVHFGVLFSDNDRNDDKSYMKIYLKSSVKFQQTITTTPCFLYWQKWVAIWVYCLEFLYLISQYSFKKARNILSCQNQEEYRRSHR